MCAFKLVLTPVDLGNALDCWIVEHAIAKTSIQQVHNLPDVNDYYPRLVCFHSKGVGEQLNIWVESLSVNEVKRLMNYDHEIHSL